MTPKGKFYKNVVRLTMLYGLVLQKYRTERMNVAKI